MEENLRQHSSNHIKIAVFGPECSGKSTLCEQLSRNFNEPIIIEFARPYLQNKINLQNQLCTAEDLLPIAIGQIQAENDAQITAKNFLFCDTNVLLTKVFSELNYGFCDASIEQAAAAHYYDLYFLTAIDMPWQADNLRDRAENRPKDFEYFENTLIKYKKPYLKLSGNESERFETAIEAVLALQKAKQLGFLPQDFIQIHQNKINVSAIAQQLDFFQNGITKMNLNRAATINDGVLQIDDAEIEKFVALFENNKNHFDLQKFVPASGAASRMFKFLNEFLKDYKTDSETVQEYINRKNATELSAFLSNINQFPFYKSILKALQSNPNYIAWNDDKKNYEFINYMLSDLDYANKPKGILPFHQHQNQLVTAVEEHLYEAIAYTKSNNSTKLHFTVSQEHEASFQSIINHQKALNLDFKNTETTFSYQHASTDTIAVDLQNKPLRNGSNELVFRPGGHGALIENLNHLHADIIFIKNIDNVSHNNLAQTVTYKKLLAGILISVQKQLFNYLLYFEKYQITEIETFATKKCNIIFNETYHNLSDSEKTTTLKSLLNRPIRVCGMVKNEGEPGGGPFWVLNEKNEISLQIVESVQIDMDNDQQATIFKTSTHFNPVDLVCGIKNYKHEKFDLQQYVNPNAGFIVQKSNNGIDLKSFELPGLWNGAMSDWITIFIEVPLATFSPVKTVNDLLKQPHQNHE